MQVEKSLVTQPELQHLSYTEVSRATRGARKLIEEGQEESHIITTIIQNGYTQDVAQAILKRARLEILNEKIKKSLTTTIVLAVLSAGAILLLPLFADDTINGGGVERRVYFFIGAIPLVTFFSFVRHLALLNERKYFSKPAA